MTNAALLEHMLISVSRPIIFLTLDTIVVRMGGVESGVGLTWQLIRARCLLARGDCGGVVRHYSIETRGF
jgi:hypothetical protein